MSDEPALRVLSLGAGVQSTTLLLLAAEGKLPKPDAAIFADTGWEPREVYTHLDRLDREVAQPAGIPILRVQRGNLREDQLEAGARVTIPVFVATEKGGSSPASIRQCTRDYKLRPITKHVRAMLGYAGRTVPSGVWVEQWIGFSTDEIHRVSGKSDAPFLRSVYPLIDLDMTRKDCVRWLTGHGWATTPKSACVGCPFHGNAAWRNLRDNHPDEWDDAVSFDRALRARGEWGPLRNAPFLHRSLIPLELAPIDRVTRTEWNSRQTDLLDAIADDLDAAIAENGDPDGCSPHGCRSGPAVDGAA